MPAEGLATTKSSFPSGEQDLTASQLLGNPIPRRRYSAARAQSTTRSPGRRAPLAEFELGERSGGKHPGASGAQRRPAATKRSHGRQLAWCLSARDPVGAIWRHAGMSGIALRTLTGPKSRARPPVDTAPLIQLLEHCATPACGALLVGQLSVIARRIARRIRPGRTRPLPVLAGPFRIGRNAVAVLVRHPHPLASLLVVGVA